MAAAYGSVPSAIAAVNQVGAADEPAR